MVFNRSMTTDADLIEQLGGPAALAKRLGYDKANGGVQRVQNWKKRGIPPGVKLKHPDVFLKAKKPRRSTAEQGVQA